jgi:hypothetical protein
MSHPKNRILRSLAVLVTVATSIVVSTRDLHAEGSCCSSKSSTPNATGVAECHSGNQSVQQRDDPPFRAAHGGQLYEGVWNYYEVVYGPRQTRVYMYDMFRYPIPTRGIQGSAFMQVRSTGREYRYPLRHTGVANGQDYLGINVDLTRVHDGDMEVRFELANLPNRDQPTFRFAQAFAMSRSVEPAANATIAVPRLPSEGRSNDHSSARPTVSVAKTAVRDRPVIEGQRVCPVMDQPLGQHGPPIELSVDGQPLFVCCEGCVGKVEANPELYLAKVVCGQQPDQLGSQNDWINRQPKQSVSGSGGSCCSSESGGRSSCH